MTINVTRTNNGRWCKSNPIHFYKFESANKMLIAIDFDDTLTMDETIDQWMHSHGIDLRVYYVGRPVVGNKGKASE